MTGTLGLAGDGDDLELIADIESAFGLRLERDEVARWRTAGDIAAAISVRLEGPGGGRCASAMAFHRLRRTLRRHLGAARARPSDRVAGIAGLRPRALAGALGADHGFAAPPGVVGGIGLAGILLGLAAFVGLVPAAILGGAPGALGTVAVLTIGAALLGADPGRFARGQTLGDLARAISARNFARLRAAGARSGGPDIWRAVQAILADHGARAPGEIARTTRIMA